ncbi:MAG: glycosyltransferase family 4 protein, partial [candidate division WOR-3 bacterium]
SRTMRICMVSDNYYPYIGGIPEHIHHLSVELRRRGHVVKVLTTNIGGRTLGCLDRVPDEDQVFRIGRGLVVRSNKSFARIPVAFRATARVRRFFEEERFDIIHIHGSLAPTLPLAAIRASRAINVITLHAGHENSIGYSAFRHWLRPFFDAIHGLVAVSETAKRSIEKYFPGEYRIIPNGIDVNLFRPDVPVVPALDNGRPKILFMGRFEPRKGLKYLLMAFPRVVEKIPDVQLVVAGTGLLGYSYRGYLDKEVEEHVHWAGLIPSEERPSYFRTCDVFCSPAIGWESFGIVLLEAMATGRPVVASDIPGYRSVVTDGREGLLVPPRDTEAIAAALVRLLQDRQLAQQMGEAGRRRSLEFSWERIADEVEALYRELIQRYPVPRFGRGAGVSSAR